MMYSEFYERTKYEPSMEEYAEIEEAYYEFNGNKDVFCQWFKKELRAGRWEREYQLRKQIRQLQESCKKWESEYSELSAQEYCTQKELEEYQNIAKKLEKELSKYAQPFIRHIVTE